jgi:hypothetical protein
MTICNPVSGAHVIYRHGALGWYVLYLNENEYNNGPEAEWYASECDWIVPGTLDIESA